MLGIKNKVKPIDREAILKQIEELLKQLHLLQAQLDAMPHDNPQALCPLLIRKRDELMKLCANHGMPIAITDQFRSFARQNELYAQGRTTPGNIVTNAKGGESLHNYGVAFDVRFISQTPYEGNWALVGELGESIGLEWGGRWTSFVDKPHMQMLLGYKLADFQNSKVDYKKFN